MAQRDPKVLKRGSSWLCLGRIICTQSSLLLPQAWSSQKQNELLLLPLLLPSLIKGESHKANDSREMLRPVWHPQDGWHQGSFPPLADGTQTQVWFGSVPSGISGANLSVWTQATSPGLTTCGPVSQLWTKRLPLFSLGMFRARFYSTRSNPVRWKVSLLVAGSWTEMNFKVLLKQNHSGILWFCKESILHNN